MCVRDLWKIRPMWSVSRLYLNRCVCNHWGRWRGWNVDSINRIIGNKIETGTWKKCINQFFCSIGVHCFILQLSIVILCTCECILCLYGRNEVDAPPSIFSLSRSISITFADRNCSINPKKRGNEWRSIDRSVVVGHYCLLKTIENRKYLQYNTPACKCIWHLNGMFIKLDNCSTYSNVRGKLQHFYFFK